MAEKRFDILFDGSLVKGFDASDVRANLKSLFKLNDETLDQLFSGKPIAIKRDLDRQSAVKYQTALTKAGAKIQLSLNRSPDAADKTVSANAPGDKAPGNTATADTPTLTLSPTGSSLLEQQEKKSTPSRPVDCSHIELADNNAFLTNELNTETAAANNSQSATSIDEVNFSLAAPGTDLGEDSIDETKMITAPNIDYLDIDPLGINLGSGEETASETIPHQIIDALTLAEAGSDILPAENKKNYEAREIDTSRLILIEED